MHLYKKIACHRSVRAGFALAALVCVPMFLAIAPTAFAGPGAQATEGRNHASATTPALPVFHLVEGAKGSPYPYTPRTLTIPAGQKVALKITDHLGGCALVTEFPNLGPDGGTVRAEVPVGQTRTITLRAPKAGRYRYHCSGNMYFGIIVAK